MLIDQFENNALFRRIMLFMIFWLIVYTIERSFGFAELSLKNNASLLDAVAIIGAINSFAMALLGYAFKIYVESRK